MEDYRMLHEEEKDKVRDGSPCESSGTGAPADTPASVNRSGPAGEPEDNCVPDERLAEVVGGRVGDLPRRTVGKIRRRSSDAGYRPSAADGITDPDKETVPQ
ncbi:MAG: hypothetical protein K6C12_15435 [Oscillospiraceae bacterium]|nr:hypothetical protein [Oscillospiraceae bacterium]